MAINKFAFTKVWTNASDFPVYEDSEVQVRADMQELHNETRDYINNTLLASVDTAITDMQTWVTGAVAAATTGTLPDGSITSAKLADGCVTAAKLSAAALTTWLQSVTYADLGV